MADPNTEHYNIRGLGNINIELRVFSAAGNGNSENRFSGQIRGQPFFC